MAKLVRWIVTCVDNGESCDGRARVLGAFKTKKEAQIYIRNDMEDRADQMAGCCESVDFDEMVIIYENDTCSCWNLEEIEFEQ